MIWNQSSGVLCKMLGPEVSDAARLLPPPGPDQPKTATVEMDTARTRLRQCGLARSPNM